MAFTVNAPSLITFRQIRKGETLEEIADKYQLAIDQIKKDNPEAKGDTGEILVLKTG